MASFPDTTPTTQDAALTALTNRLIAAGLTPGSGLDKNGTVYSAIANLMAYLPTSANTGFVSGTGGTGFTAGTGTLLKTGVERVGDLIITRIFVDLTGVKSFAAGDIIGVNASTNPAHIGQITAAVNGTIVGGRMIWSEVPATGDTDIDLYAATEGTGQPDAAITTLVETQAINTGTISLGTVGSLIADSIAADKYLYLVSVGATAAVYTAGRGTLELYGY